MRIGTRGFGVLAGIALIVSACTGRRDDRARHRTAVRGGLGGTVNRTDLGRAFGHAGPELRAEA